MTKRLGDYRIVTCGKYEKVSGAKSLSIVALNLSIYLNPKGHHYRHNVVICKAQHIMLMEYTRRLLKKENEMFVYDLKGSSHGRWSKGKLTSKTMRKDLDWIKDKKQNKTVHGISEINQGTVK